MVDCSNLTSQNQAPIQLREMLPEIVGEHASSRAARDPDWFWASQIGFCRRQLYNAKLGISDQSDRLGRLLASQIVQEKLSEMVTEHYGHLDTTTQAVIQTDDVRITGRPTFHNPETDTVVHVKPRDGWYKYHPPNQRHIDQLQAYMAGLGAKRGQLLYVDIADLSDVRTWPPDADERLYVTPDDDRLEMLVEKAKSIRGEIMKEGFATAEHEIPFDRCNCYLCETESLTFSEEVDLPDAEEARSRTEARSISETDTVADCEGNKTVSSPPETSDQMEFASSDGGLEVVASSQKRIPKEVRDLDIWVVWDERTKRPLAPWATGTMYPCEWASDKIADPKSTFEKAKMVAELNPTQIHDSWPFPNENDLPKQISPAVLLPHQATKANIAVVDIDDVRHPQTGETTSEAQSLIDALGSYTEISQSGTGFHVFLQAGLPADTKSVSAALSDTGSIEIYDSSRFVACTWQHALGTPDEINPNQTELSGIINQYAQH